VSRAVKFGLWGAAAGLLFFGSGLSSLLLGAIGAYLGKSIDESEAASARARRAREASSRRRAAGASAADDAGADDFALSYLALVAAVMKADGRVTRQELAVVKEFLASSYDPDTAQRMLHALRELVSHDAPYPVSAICAILRRHMPRSQRRLLLHLLLRVARADGDYSREEERLLLSIASALGFDPAEFARAEAGARETRGEPSLADDYALLGVAESASDGELRKAYRREAMKHHPDRVANLGEAAVREATGKFQAINAAYERIRASRGGK